MPVAAAQLLFTVGVTCALAFELPSMPLYHITQQLRENLQKRLHPTIAPAVNASSNSTEDNHSRIDYNNVHLKYINTKQNYYDAMNKHSYYYNSGMNNNYDDKNYQKLYNGISNKQDNDFLIQNQSSNAPTSANNGTIMELMKKWVLILRS
jgi:hypothetical protein